jgi:thiol-disulfide isomerase/thioredoxin
MKYIPLLLLLTSMLGSATAQSIDWEEAPQYETAVNGKPDYQCKVFQPSSSRPYLIAQSKLFPDGILIDLGGKKITELGRDDIKPDGEFTIATKGVPKGAFISNYSVKAGVTVFDFKGKSVSIRIRESLVGEVGESMLLAHSPLYRILRDAYKPKKQQLDFLRKYGRKTDFVVMFATWCPTCKKVVPALMRLLKDAANGSFSVRYIGIAMGGSEPSKELERYGHEYPDIIAFRAGREIGRITGEPSGPLENALVALLKK